MYHKNSASPPVAVREGNSLAGGSGSSCSSGAGGTTPTNLVRPLSINLKDHCVLCLQPEDARILEEILTRNPKAILNFQPLVYYLTGIDPTDTEELQRLTERHKYFPVMANLPPMCGQCYAILGDMYRLHQELVDVQVRIQKQIALARRIVKYTAKEDRGGRVGGTVRSQLFRKMGTGMRSLLTREEMEGLRYFLENFHGLIIEAEDKFIFPCPPPPPDPHSTTPKSPPPTPPSLMTLSYPVKFTFGSSPTPPPSKVPPVRQQPAPPPQKSPPATPQRSSSSSSSELNGGGGSSELIMVSGINHNLKYEVEDDLEDEEDEHDFQVEGEEEPSVNSIVLIKEDLEEDDFTATYSTNHTDNQIQIKTEEVDEEIDPPPTCQPCDICNQILPLSQLPSHLHSHLGRNGYSCDVCSRVYLSKSKLLHHVTSSSCSLHSLWYQNLIHFCTACSTAYPSEQSLHHHVFSTHELDSNNTSNSLHPCKKCGVQYRTEIALDFHLASHLHSSHLSCSESWKHFQALLPPNPPSTAQITTTVTTSGIRRRRRGGDGGNVSSSSSPPDYSCEICGKKCVGSTSLLRHVKEVHKGQGKRKTTGVGASEVDASPAGGKQSRNS